MLLDIQAAALFGDGSPPSTAILSDYGAWILAFGGLVATLLIRAEALYALWAKIRQDWFTSTSAQEAVTVAELKAHIKLLKSDYAEVKAEVVDLRSSITYFSHEQSEFLVEEEKLWGYITLLYDHADRQAQIFKKGGLDAESPPPLPDRKERSLAGEAYHARTKATNARLAREAAVVVGVTVPPPAPLPPESRGQP